MTLQAVADTHTVIWHIFADGHLSNAAKEFIEDSATNGNQVGFSSITLAEIIYLGIIYLMPYGIKVGLKCHSESLIRGEESKACATNKLVTFYIPLSASLHSEWHMGNQ